MYIELKIPTDIDVTNKEQLAKYTQIFTVLISKGALDGVKNGRAILHFDWQGDFAGIELDYWPWRTRRTQNGLKPQYKNI